MRVSLNKPGTLFNQKNTIDKGLRDVDLVVFSSTTILQHYDTGIFVYKGNIISKKISNPFGHI